MVSSVHTSSTASVPRVSIGLPVYNGDRYLASAIESLLSQTYADLELVISDNASTDRTAEICQQYADSDDRVRYFRSDVNRGASWNFNRAFELARGTYFKWAAHDDSCAPEMMEKCVRVLDRDADVILCSTWARIFDADGNHIADYSKRFATEARDPYARFASLLLRGNKAFQVFGLIRADALRRTDLIGDYFMSDEVLLARLALMGRFHEIPEHLFYSREHPGQSIRMFERPDLYAAWFNPAHEGRRVYPYWRLAREYARAVGDSDVGLSTRLRCYGTVLRMCMNKRGYLVRSALYGIGGALGLSTRSMARAWRNS